MAAVTNATEISIITVPPFHDPYDYADGGATFATAGRVIPARGIRMPHGSNTSVYRVFKWSQDVGTGGTGIKVDLLYCLDPLAANADVTGTKINWGLNAGVLTSGTSLPDDSALGTETATQSAALPTSVGVVVVTAITNATANNASFTTNTWGIIRVRRLGTSTNDTNTGNIILLGMDVYTY
jgi:hypothetical protein